MNHQTECKLWVFYVTYSRTCPRQTEILVPCFLSIRILINNYYLLHHFLRIYTVIAEEILFILGLNKKCVNKKIKGQLLLQPCLEKYLILWMELWKEKNKTTKDLSDVTYTYALAFIFNVSNFFKCSIAGDGLLNYLCRFSSYSPTFITSLLITSLSFWGSGYTIGVVKLLLQSYILVNTSFRINLVDRPYILYSFEFTREAIVN